MSLELNDPLTQPPLTCKASSNHLVFIAGDGQGMGLQITLDDFMALAKYVFGNTNLTGPDDPRIRFQRAIAGAKVAEGWWEHGERLVPLEQRAGETTPCGALCFLETEDGRDLVFRCEGTKEHYGKHFCINNSSEVFWAEDQRHNCPHHGRQETKDCHACFYTPITCKIHGTRSEYFCSACTDEYRCPEHGKSGHGTTSCQVWDCDHSAEKDWVKDYDRKSPYYGKQET